MAVSKLRAEAERLVRKAKTSKRASEQRMLETHARFYEMIADLDEEVSHPFQSKGDQQESRDGDHC